MCTYLGRMDDPPEVLQVPRMYVQFHSSRKQVAENVSSVCNTPKKCVFVRVVDSCAGCKKGSKHVDLTQAAFKELASLDEGLLQVQMRQATDPDGW